MPKINEVKDKTGSKNHSPTKLYRSEKDRVIAGVCAGLGEFFQVDPTIVRLIFIIITIFGGGGILLYLILWLIIPSQKADPQLTKDNIEKNAEEIKDKAQQFAKDMKINTTNLNSRQLFGVAILVLGIMLLLGNFGFVSFRYVWKFFPAIVVIILGVAILKKRD
jgi:phage shock protein C